MSESTEPKVETTQPTKPDEVRAATLRHPSINPTIHIDHTLCFTLAGGRFAEVIGQVKVVRSFTAELREIAFFGSRFRRTISLTRDQSTWWHRMDALRGGILNIIFALERDSINAYVCTFLTGGLFLGCYGQPQSPHLISRGWSIRAIRAIRAIRV